MNPTSPSAQKPPQMPAAGGLLLRLGIAAAVGLFLTVCVIMPAEYRKDPTGFGRMTGLLDLRRPVIDASAAVSASSANANLLVPRIDDLTDIPIDREIYGEDAQAVVVGVPQEISRVYPEGYKTDTVELKLGPDGEVEYKVKLKAGYTMLYDWSVSPGGKVYYDFHGHPEDRPEDATSYRQVQEDTHQSGALVAPVEGIHGWYWLNLTGDPITITLHLAGFYESHGVVE